MMYSAGIVCLLAHFSIFNSHICLPWGFSTSPDQVAPCRAGEVSSLKVCQVGTLLENWFLGGPGVGESYGTNWLLKEGETGEPLDKR